jgi:hypothetical protein
VTLLRVWLAESEVYFALIMAGRKWSITCFNRGWLESEYVLLQLWLAEKEV